MIDEKMIQTAVVRKLNNIGINVTADEVKEGFNKPTAFVTVIPQTAEMLNRYREHLTVSVTIKYIPAIETVEECANTAIKIRKAFFYESLIVSDRKLTIENMEFDTEDKVLYTYFDLDFIQETINAEDADDKFEELEMEGF